MKRHYLYRHIRLDTNEVFYVGIGTKSKKDILNYTYSRAKSKGSRTSFWKNIISKSQYEIEILLESDSYDFIKQKEIEFIALYGRRDLGLGELTNLTDGGDGTLGYLITDNYRNNLKTARKLSFENGYRVKGKSVFQYCAETGKFLKEWEHRVDAANIINVSRGSIGNACKGVNNHYCKGYLWYDKYKGDVVSSIKGTIRNYNSKIIMIDRITNMELFEFDSMSMAFKFLMKSHSGLIRRAIRNNSIAYNYKWKEK